MPPDVFTLSDLKDILLIGPRSTFLRIGGASSASEWEVRWRLTRRLEQTGTLGALHDAAKRWGLDGAARPALSSSLLDRVLDAVRLGQLAGFVLPTVEIAASYGADIEAGRAALMAVRPERLRTAAGPQAGGPKPATGFALLPLEQRLATIVDRSETLLPASGRGLYRDVYQPGLLAKMVAALSFWAKTQDGATTPILSAVFWAGGTRRSTRRVVDTTADLVEMLDLARKAKTDTDADGAARHLARIIATVGAEDFVRIIQIVPDKIKGGGPVREVYVYPPIPPIVRPPQERPRREDEKVEPKPDPPLTKRGLVSAAATGGPAKPGQGLQTSIAAMTLPEKMREAIKRAHGNGQISDEVFRQLNIPEVIKGIIALEIVFGAITLTGATVAATGVGAVAEGVAAGTIAAIILVLSAEGLIASARQIKNGLGALADFHKLCDRAQTPQDLDAAGGKFAEGIAELGVGAATGLLSYTAGRHGAARVEEVAAGVAPSPPKAMAPREIAEELPKYPDSPYRDKSRPPEDIQRETNQELARQRQDNAKTANEELSRQNKEIDELHENYVKTGRWKHDGLDDHTFPDENLKARRELEIQKQVGLDGGEEGQIGEIGGPPPLGKRVDLFHGSKDISMFPNGKLDPEYDGAFYTAQDPRVAEEAIKHHASFDQAPRPGLLHASIPKDKFDSLVASGDIKIRKYKGFYGNLDTVEIMFVTPEAKKLFNKHIK